MSGGRRKVVVHLGTMKTGTSSIQAMLAANPEWLAERGYAYLGWPLRHHRLMARRVEAVDPELNVIVCDEGLWHFAGTAHSDTKLIARLFADWDVHLVVYLRRPDEFFQAWFIQGLKLGTGNPRLDQFFASPSVRKASNYEQRLRYFARHFPEAKVTVVPYERSQMLEGDACLDFLDRVGLLAGEDGGKVSDLVLPSEQNVSPPVWNLLLVSLLRQRMKMSERSLGAVQSVLDRLRRLRMGRVSSRILLRADEIAELNEVYQPMCARIAARYGAAEPMFFERWLDPAEVRTSAFRSIYQRSLPPSDGPGSGAASRSPVTRALSLADAPKDVP